MTEISRLPRMVDGVPVVAAPAEIDAVTSDRLQMVLQPSHPCLPAGLGFPQQRPGRRAMKRLGLTIGRFLFRSYSTYRIIRIFYKLHRV
jgi:hypothetical protein